MSSDPNKPAPAAPNRRPAGSSPWSDPSLLRKEPSEAELQRERTWNWCPGSIG
jgi:hypothetical protein